MTTVVTPHSERDPRRPGLAWASGLIVLAIADLVVWLNATRQGFGLPAFGSDLNLYRDAVTRWLADGSFYWPWQLRGPYDPLHGGLPILYPPTTIPLFAAFTVLPAFLWWAIPAAVIVAVLRHHRTRASALVIIGLLLIWPTTSVSLIWTGNPVMWACAALAVATVRPSIGPLVLLKPSLGVFALWGVAHRSWWIALLPFALFSLSLLPLWSDYIAVLRNAQADVTYSLWNVPLMLVPIIGWLGRRAEAPQAVANRASRGIGVSRAPRATQPLIRRVAGGAAPGTFVARITGGDQG